MTTTPTELPPATADLRDLGRADVLDAVVEARRAADREEARLLALAVHWVDLHPVEADTPATFRAAQPGGRATGLAPSMFDVASLAGEGTPGVSELAVTELAAALDLSYAAGLARVSEAVELCFRLPRLWALVQDGSLQAWKARRVAQATTTLSREAVDFVDRHLAVTARRNRIPAINPVLHEARLQCDPDQAAAVEQAALDARGVFLDHRESTATTKVIATLDTVDALDLDASLSAVATTMGRLGDRRELDVRRASALALLAHPQRVLDLLAGEAPAPATPAPASRATLYLHVDATHLAAGPGGGTVEKLGSATLELLRDWLARTDHVSVRPVLDLARTDAVDRHDPPPWMRDLVVLRDAHCVFPGCSLDSRGCDLDHLDPYVPPDEGGRPGQTRPANLAPLCRRHHRTKTFGGWTYRRLPDDPDHPGATYEWTSPSHRTYRVITRPR